MAEVMRQSCSNASFIVAVALTVLLPIAACVSGQISAPTPTQSAPAHVDARVGDPTVAGPDVNPTPDAALTDGLPTAPGTLPTTAPSAAIVLSEILYNPVAEEDAQDNHEFVELYNRSSTPVSLQGWTLAGTITYQFGPGVTLEAGKYLVVAKNPARLTADVPRYELGRAAVVGPYTGDLDNGGGTVSVLDASGAVVDGVKYDDKAPWPIAADALGASESWFAATDPRVPFAKHQYMGVSLERIDVALPGNDVSNWAPSPLDGATPGRKSATPTEPPPIVESFTAVAKDGAPLIRMGQPVVIRARTVGPGVISAFKVEWFVDDIARTDEPIKTVELARAADDYEATIPPQPDSAVVRFRFVGDRGGGDGAISPRPSDPFAWHAYFVTPAVDSAARTYHLFIAPPDWTRLHQWTKPGMMLGCMPNPNWNSRVPAVVVVGGRVFDVQVRYSGSWSHRLRGPVIPSWKAPGPSEPAPLKALSWSFRFPRYRQLDGRSGMILNKMNNNCCGVEWFVTSSLMSQVGLATPSVRFARLHINGAYYRYTMELDDWNESLVDRAYGPGMGAGDLFSVGGWYNPGMGPLGPGDGTVLAPVRLHGHAALRGHVQAPGAVVEGG